MDENLGENQNLAFHPTLTTHICQLPLTFHTKCCSPLLALLSSLLLLLPLQLTLSLTMKNPLSVFTRSAGQSTLEAYMFVHRSSRGKPHTETLTLSLIKATGSSSTSVVQTGIQMLALVTTSVVSIFTFRVIKSLSFNSINTFRHSQEW